MCCHVQNSQNCVNFYFFFYFKFKFRKTSFRKILWIQCLGVLTTPNRNEFHRICHRTNQQALVYLTFNTFQKFSLNTKTNKTQIRLNACLLNKLDGYLFEHLSNNIYTFVVVFSRNFFFGACRNLSHHRE